MRDQFGQKLFQADAVKRVIGLCCHARGEGLLE